MWLSRTGRPDISHAVTILASVTGSWDETAERGLIRLVGYLKHTEGHLLYYQTFEENRRSVDTPIDDTSIQFKTYVDASLQDPRSYSGGVITVGIPGVGECAIEWWSRKQRVAVVSSMMAEVIALMEGLVESTALRELSKFPVRLLCDNQPAIRVVQQGYSSAMSAYTRPLRLRLCALKDMVELEQIDIVYVPSKDNMSDLLTKVFTRFEQARLSRLIGMRPPPRVGDLVKSDGTWIVGDPVEEEEERREREATKRGYIEEAMRNKKMVKTGGEGKLCPPLDEMDA